MMIESERAVNLETLPLQTTTKSIQKLMIFSRTNLLIYKWNLKIFLYQNLANNKGLLTFATGIKEITPYNNNNKKKNNNKLNISRHLYPTTTATTTTELTNETTIKEKRLPPPPVTTSTANQAPTAIATTISITTLTPSLSPVLNKSPKNEWKHQFKRHESIKTWWVAGEITWKTIFIAEGWSSSVCKDLNWMNIIASSGCSYISQVLSMQVIRMSWRIVW